MVTFCISYWQIPEGNGSGVVWDEEGHIVTNYHGENQSRNYSSTLSLIQFYAKSELMFSHIENYRHLYAFSIDSLHQDFSELCENFKIM